MAWSFVQSIGSAALASSHGVTFANNVASGNKIIVVVTVASSSTSAVTTSSVKDGASNSWTAIANEPFTDTQTGDKGNVSIWALDVPAGDVGTKPTITATGGSGTVVIGVLACEVSGLLAGNTTAMADGTAGVSTGGGGQASTTSPTYSSTAANEFLIAVYGDYGNGTTWTNPSGYQGATAGPGSSGAAEGVNDSTDCNIELAYKNSTDGSETASFTTTGSSSGYGELLVAFKLASAAAQPFDIPKFEPGPFWLQLFKPGLPKPNIRMTPPGAPSIGATGSFTLAPLAFSSSGSQTSPDVPQIFPGNTWFSLFKPWAPTPPPVPPAVQQVTANGSFSLAPLAFAGTGSQSSPDVTQINPGTTWLSLFKGWVPRPFPVPPAVQGVNGTASFSLSPVAFSSQGSQTSPDVPQFQPGPFWLQLFKPGVYKPVPPPPAVQSVSATASFSLAPFAFSAQGNQTSPDVPQIFPGTTWFDLFKPGLPRQRPQTATQQVLGITSSGNFALAPLAFSAQGSSTSPDMPQVQPGPYWLSWFKPGLYKPLPPVPAVQGVSATGSFTLAVLAFQAQGNQTSPDVPQVNPGTTWMALFKGWVPRPFPAPPAYQSVSGTGSFSLAALKFAAQGNQTSPDVPQINPGTTWLGLFKPGLPRQRPVPPVAPPASASASFALAPLAFSARGAQTSPDVPQVNPGPFWLSIFKPGIPKPPPVPPAVQSVHATGSFSLAPLAFLANGSVFTPLDDQPQINPGPRWLALFKHRQRPVPPAVPAARTESGPFSIYLPGGCIKFGPFRIGIPAPQVALQGYAGRFGPLTVALPSAVVSLTGVHTPPWAGFAIPPLRVSLTGKIQGGAFNITLPPPKTALTGTTLHVHSGAFNISMTCLGGGVGRVFIALDPPPDAEPANWTLSQPVTTWKTYLPWEAWNVGYATVTLSHLSTQYVLIPVSATKNGSSYNPTSDTVQFAFAPTPTYVPQNSDWVSGSWITNSSNILYPYSAQCLVGPGGTTSLGLGTYQIYIKISDSPETPVLVAGQLVVT